MEILEAINVQDYQCEVSCPNCDQNLSVEFRSVVEEKILDCDVCGQKIKLVDQEGAAKEFIGRINRILNNLDEELGHLVGDLAPKLKIHDADK